MNFQKKLERFKEITQEENKIISIIKKNVMINKKTKILDVGSNIGNISKALQTNLKNITLIDIEELNINQKVNFIKNKFEDVELNDKFDIIITSHVWGHFDFTRTSESVFKKIMRYKKEDGKVIIVYNINKDFLKDLINLSKSIFKEFQYDSFNENLIKNLNYKTISFSIILKEKTFEKLTELIQILMIVKDKEFELKKDEILRFLKSRLKEPEFEIQQNLIIIE